MYKSPGQQWTLGQVVELTKRFIEAYQVYRDEPRVIRLTDKVRRYNRKLRDLGLKDHQVERATTQRKLRNLLLLIYRSNLLLAWAILALPGVITHAPIFIPAKMYSKVKAKGIYLVTSIYPCKRADMRNHLAEALAASSVKIAARDVIATWKILFSLAATPALYIVYAILATWLAWRNGASSAVVKSMPALIFIIMPFFAMSSLKFGEAGMDVFKSVHPCLLTPNIAAHPPSLQIITTTFPFLVARKPERARKIAQNPRIARQRAVRSDQLVARNRIKFTRATN